MNINMERNENNFRATPTKIGKVVDIDPNKFFQKMTFQNLFNDIQNDKQHLHNQNYNYYQLQPNTSSAAQSQPVSCFTAAVDNQYSRQDFLQREFEDAGDWSQTASTQHSAPSSAFASPFFLTPTKAYETATTAESLSTSDDDRIYVPQNQVNYQEQICQKKKHITPQSLQSPSFSSSNDNSSKQKTPQVLYLQQHILNFFNTPARDDFLSEILEAQFVPAKMK